MQLYLNLFGLWLPSYGLMITIGVLLANAIAFAIIKRSGDSIEDFIILEAYTIWGGLIGAKLLYIALIFDTIDWSSFSLKTLSELLQGGFVFYGGLIGAVLMFLLAGKLHKINSRLYIQRLIFVIPLMHGFGRIGCFLAGCCYGKEYSGFLSVVYPEGSLAPSGTPRFPVQAVEAALLLILAVILFFISKKDSRHGICVYLLSYSVIRFFLEFMRDDFRGSLLGLSTSQFISILLLLGTLLWCIFIRTNQKSRRT